MIFALTLLISFAHAADRQIIGGDIMYKASAEAKDPTMAQFLSQQAAIKSIISECGIPHRDIKVYSTDLDRTMTGFIAQSAAGLAFEDCQEGKRARPERKEKLSSPEIAKNQDLYEKYLKEQMGLNKPKVHVVDNSKELKEISGKLEAIDQKLTHQIDNPTPAVERTIIIQSPEGKPLPQRQPSAECWAKVKELKDEAAAAQAEEGGRGMSSPRASRIWSRSEEQRIKCMREANSQR